MPQERCPSLPESARLSGSERETHLFSSQTKLLEVNIGVHSRNPRVNVASVPSPEDSAVLFCMAEGSFVPTASIFREAMLLLSLWGGQKKCLTNSSASSHLLGSCRGLLCLCCSSREGHRVGQVPAGCAGTS